MDEMVLARLPLYQMSCSLKNLHSSRYKAIHVELEILIILLEDRFLRNQFFLNQFFLR